MHEGCWNARSSTKSRETPVPSHLEYCVQWWLPSMRDTDRESPTESHKLFRDWSCRHTRESGRVHVQPGVEKVQGESSVLVNTWQRSKEDGDRLFSMVPRAIMRKFGTNGNRIQFRHIFPYYKVDWTFKLVVQGGYGGLYPADTQNSTGHGSDHPTPGVLALRVEGLELDYIQRCLPDSDTLCFCDSGNIVPSPRLRTEYSADCGKPWKPGYSKHKLSVTSLDTSHRSATVRTTPENSGKVHSVGCCELFWFPTKTLACRDLPVEIF